jgi:cold shock CspA family protein
MAKSKETINKREKEKKKLTQQRDKKLKSEERKANKKKGGSLEDMMAYLDEDGNLTSQPQDPRIKKSYNLEDMQISIPKQEDRKEVFRNGVVNFFDKSKGFGFINDVQSNERIFFHINNLLEAVNENDKVEFLVEKSPRGPNAIQVKKMI